ncbi:hypothetical protein ACOMHN_066697 [Nucella lapillus]
MRWTAFTCGLLGKYTPTDINRSTVLQTGRSGRASDSSVRQVGQAERQTGRSDRAVRQVGQAGRPGRLVRQVGQAERQTGRSDRSVRQVGQTGRSGRSARQVGQAGWSGRASDWSVRQVGQAGRSGRSVRQVGQAGWSGRASDWSVRQVGQAGRSGRSVRQVGQAGRSGRSVRQVVQAAPRPPPNKSPVFKSECSKSISKTAVPGKTGAAVSWPSSKFHASDPDSDGVKVISVSSKSSGSYFREGTTEVIYKAYDTRGGAAYCTFRVHIKVIYCKALPVPQYGRRECSARNVYGSRCSVTCNPGYTRQGPRDLNCRRGGDWSAATPTCQPVSCGRPDRVEHGEVQCARGHGYPQVCSVQCRQGYRYAGGYPFIRCRQDASWDPLNVCLDVEAPTFPNGCPDDLTLTSGPLGSAVAVNWTAPEAVDNSEQSVTLTTSLDPGTRLEPGSHTVTVTATDAAGNSHSCTFHVHVELLACDALTMAQGSVSCTSGHMAGSVCAVTCVRGHVVSGNATLTCTDADQGPAWDNADTSCEVVQCPVPRLSRGSFVCPDGRSYAKLCVPVCEAGFRYRGVGYIQCSVNGSWTDIGHCQDVEPPSFPEGCPDNINTFSASLGESTNITWGIPDATDNAGEVEVSSDREPGSDFPIGVTTVKYTAVDEAGNAQQCSFTVTVQTLVCDKPDFEKGKSRKWLTYACPDGYVYGASCTLNCSYSYPLQGPSQVACNKSDVTFPPRMAWTWEGSSAAPPQCIESPCPDLAPPQNGALSCHLGNFGWDCLMACQDPYDVPASVGTGHFYCTNADGFWAPADVPDCSVKRRARQVKVQSDLFYYADSCDMALDDLRASFITRMNGHHVLKNACIDVPTCVVENVKTTQYNVGQYTTGNTQYNVGQYTTGNTQYIVGQYTTGNTWTTQYTVGNFTTGTTQYNVGNYTTGTTQYNVGKYITGNTQYNVEYTTGTTQYNVEYTTGTTQYNIGNYTTGTTQYNVGSFTTGTTQYNVGNYTTGITQYNVGTTQHNVEYTTGNTQYNVEYTTGNTQYTVEYTTGTTQYNVEYTTGNTQYNVEYTTGTTQCTVEYTTGTTQYNVEYTTGNTQYNVEYTTGTTQYNVEYTTGTTQYNVEYTTGNTRTTQYSVGNFTTGNTRTTQYTVGNFPTGNTQYNVGNFTTGNTQYNVEYTTGNTRTTQYSVGQYTTRTTQYSVGNYTTGNTQYSVGKYTPGNTQYTVGQYTTGNTRTTQCNVGKYTLGNTQYSVGKYTPGNTQYSVGKYTPGNTQYSVGNTPQGTHGPHSTMLVHCGSTRGKREAGGERDAHPGRRQPHRVFRRQVQDSAYYVMITFEVPINISQSDNSTAQDIYQMCEGVRENLHKVMVAEVAKGTFNEENLFLNPSEAVGEPTMKAVCPPGTVARPLVGHFSCVGCSEGYYLSGETGRCAACLVGSYSDIDNATECAPCPEGHSTQATAAKNASLCLGQCPVGQVSPTGFVPCQPCPAGQYQPGAGATRCVHCPVNTWTLRAGARSDQDCIDAAIALSNSSVSGTFVTNNLSVLTVTFRVGFPNAHSNVTVYLQSSDRSVLGSKVFSALEADVDEVKESKQRLFHRFKFSVIRVGSELSPNLALSFYSKQRRVLLSSLAVFGGNMTLEEIESRSNGCRVDLSLNLLTWSPDPSAVQMPSQCDAVDECSANPCGDHGVCVNALGGYECECREGWGGATCRLPPDPCQDHRCQNGATCRTESAGGNYTCRCLQGFAGPLCELEKVDGGWTDWQGWSPCECGGQQRRQRQCSNPSPLNGGRPCPGARIHVINCSACPSKGQMDSFPV